MIHNVSLFMNYVCLLHRRTIVYCKLTFIFKCVFIIMFLSTFVGCCYFSFGVRVYVYVPRLCVLLLKKCLFSCLSISFSFSISISLKSINKKWSPVICSLQYDINSFPLLHSIHSVLTTTLLLDIIYIWNLKRNPIRIDAEFSCNKI